jgi:proline iminopeptidase
MEIPYALHKAWPGSELIVVENEGHGGEVMANEVTKAVARLAVA